jgi:hypothetical protein
MRSWPIYGAVVLVFGCRIPNEDHCGRQRGDASCAALDPSRPYCSECEAENDGCVESLAEIGLECRPEGSIAEAETTAETTLESESEASTEIGTDTETETGTDSGETGPEPECGNGIKEADEDCDGTQFGDSTCADPYGLPEGMLVCVPGACVIETSQCCLLAGELCERGECCNDDCNLITNKCTL